MSSVPAISLPVKPRIGIVMMSAVGDAVHVLPVLDALKRHSPDAHVVTVTLAPDHLADYRREASDDPMDVRFALRESSHTDFLYSGSDAAGKVEQLFADSKQLDVSPWAGRCDLVFVDGSHAYSYVVSDSELALRLVAPGGLVLWHDYAGPRHAAGVYRALNELSTRLPLVRLEGTTLVAHRRPVES